MIPALLLSNHTGFVSVRVGGERNVGTRSRWKRQVQNRSRLLIIRGSYRQPFSPEHLGVGLGEIGARVPGVYNIQLATVRGEREGSVANEGFWGIPVRPSTRYRVSFYATGQTSLDIIRLRRPIALYKVSHDS